MIKKRYFLVLFVTIVIYFILIILGKTYINKTTSQQKAIYRSRMVPTVFVPGSGATNNRFDDMISELNKTHRKHSILKVEVSKDNQLTYSGGISSNDEHPFIVVGFENNLDGYDNIKQQAKWLDTAMHNLQLRYKFQRFNAVGHSNGGLNWTIFLEKYYSSEQFQMEKLLTIGTPYNFEESNFSNKTQMLKDLINERNVITSNLLVYNLAGTNTFEGDKIVPYESVEAGKFIFQKVAKHYTQVTVTGDDATHSDLPTNPEVIQYLAEKLLKPKP
ncbi:alpha/beta hydrolase [Streptococcus pseudoporcinus]|uniref:Alpha/beta hydrolase, PF06028 family n=1 Tax=Streptococcus pseudoporcinus LQ 940-04 TaxID=875093 RepID=G5K8J9_9STRE|nr:alpha/beta hydrolase [Streptococcus pseudoporcinus]EFR44070.1 hypothetical protein HMPREF9320_0282 [Streptococcus pseudoporcinus SPIN 20026]EHI65097.1 hypothetical protein STRPS_1355 [Streptococcus pseudoporcinus LQ 940-04]VEF94223.1 cell surface hydrolase (putative) [Streptococcus pseudoporcinus]